MNDLDAAIEANAICVRWVGDHWVWCCQRHDYGAEWLSDYYADGPDGRAEVAEHLAEHAAFDAQPRQVAHRAILGVLAKPKFRSDQELAAEILDAAWDVTTQTAVPPAEPTTEPEPGEVPDSVVQAVLEALGWPDDREGPLSDIGVGSHWELASDVARAAVTAWEYRHYRQRWIAGPDDNLTVARGAIEAWEAEQRRDVRAAEIFREDPTAAGS